MQVEKNHLKASLNNKKNHRKFSDKLHNLIKKNGWLTK